VRIQNRPIHPDFLALLQEKEPALVELFCDLRAFLLALHPAANELLYHTHALTSGFSVSDRLGDAYCMLPIYSNHVNLGFNKGTLLPDPHQLLAGTGKLIRHVPVQKPGDYRNPQVKVLVKAAVDLASAGISKPGRSVGMTVSKITKHQA
jgi:hypothetical protein